MMDINRLIDERQQMAAPKTMMDWSDCLTRLMMRSKDGSDRGSIAPTSNVLM